MIKKILKKNKFIYSFLKEKQLIYNWNLNKKNYLNEIKKWQLNKDYPIYNHYVKQFTIRKYASEVNAENLIETGTFYGEMMYMLYDQFNHLFSIELSEVLFNNALKRFKKLKKIKLYQGDSSNILKTIIPILNSNAIFWLDGHYSGGETAKGSLICPILKELQIISEIKNHDFIILIDDARLFDGTDDYPTHDNLVFYVNKYFENFTISIQNDIYIIKK